MIADWPESVKPAKPPPAVQMPSCASPVASAPWKPNSAASFWPNNPVRAGCTPAELNQPMIENWDRSFIRLALVSAYDDKPSPFTALLAFSKPTKSGGCGPVAASDTLEYDAANPPQ